MKTTDFDRVVDLVTYKNQYVLIKKLHKLLGSHNCKYKCRMCLNSYTSHSVSLKHEQPCGQQEITSIKTSIESNVYWKKTFS